MAVNFVVRGINDPKFTLRSSNLVYHPYSWI